MTREDLQLLKGNIDKIVRIVCTDGEVLVARVHAVSDEDEDVIYDLISTTKETHYGKTGKQPAYLIRYRDIVRVEAVGNP